MKRNNHHILSVLYFFILFTYAGTSVKAQKAILSLDTSAIRIGERVQLRLNATLPKSATIYWPAIADTLTASVEVAGKSKVDTNATSRQDFVNYSQTIIITSFDTGFHNIPPFSINYSYSGDTSRHELLSEGAYLKVRMVEVDTTKAIRDIRGPIHAPISFEEMIPILGGVALVGLVIAMIWYYFWRKKMNKPLFPVITRTQGPPWQLALQSLDLLEKEQLWQNGKNKEYYSELTDILRQYLNKQHNIDALEMITSEILAAYDTAGLNIESRSLLANILTLADFAKFAKATPFKNENELSMTYARQFVEATKPVAPVTDKNNTENTESNTEAISE